MLLKTRFFKLRFCCRQYWSNFNHFDVVNPEPEAIEVGEITQKITAITPFKFIQGHGFWYQLKASMRFYVCQ